MYPYMYMYIRLFPLGDQAERSLAAERANNEFNRLWDSPPLYYDLIDLDEDLLDDDEVDDMFRVDLGFPRERDFSPDSMVRFYVGYYA